MHLTITHAGKCNPLALRESGIGLIEVLITLFILAIGLLGIAGTQLMSKRANFEATQRTTATHLANDILERMRANSAPTVATASMLPEYVVNGGGLGGETISTAPPAPTAGDTEAIMFRDLWEWEQAIDGAAETTGADAVKTGGLVSPSACIYTDVDAAAINKSGRYMFTIVWRGTAKLSDPVNPASPVPAVDPYVCGRASGQYDSTDDPPVVDAHRRILIVDTFIAQ